MKLRKNLVLICFFGSLSISSSFAQAWTLKQGKSYSQVSYSHIEGTSKYNKFGDPIDLNRKVTDRTLQFYDEYGFTDRLMMVTNFPIKYITTGKEVLETSSNDLQEVLESGSMLELGNVSLAFVYGIDQKGKLVYSAQLKYEFRTSLQDADVGIRSGYLGWGIAPSFHIGYSGDKFWSAFDFGPNFRSNDFSTQLISSLQIGTKASEKIHAILQFHLLESLENGNHPDGNATQTGLYTNDIEFTALNLKFGYEVSKVITIWAALGGGFSGHDVTRAPALNIALSVKDLYAKKKNRGE